MSNIKEVIFKQLNYCNAIAVDIIKNNASEEVINHAKKWVQVESPITGETDAPWIRVNYGDIYVFANLDEAELMKNNIKFTGQMRYQLDGLGEYGAELIDVNSIQDFKEKLTGLTEKEIIEQHYVFQENGDYSADAPQEYYAIYSIKPEKEKIYGLTKERYNQLAERGVSIQDYIRVFGVEAINKGYDIFTSYGSEVVIDGALTVEGIDMLNFFESDFDACRQAEEDGVKFINDIDGLEKGCYVDTPENRKHCIEMLKKHPEYRVENWIDYNDEYGSKYAEYFGINVEETVKPAVVQTLSEDNPDMIKFWSNAAGDLHHHGKYDITEDELPEELKRAYNELWNESHGSYCYLVETEKGYGVALINEYDDVTADDNKISMKALYDCVEKDAQKISELPYFKNAEIFTGENSGFSECHELIVVFPAMTPVEEFEKAAYILDEVVYNSVKEKELTPHLVTIKETYTRTVVVYGEDSIDSEEIAEDLCNVGEIDITSKDFSEREIIFSMPVNEGRIEGYEVYNKPKSIEEKIADAMARKEKNDKINGKNKSLDNIEHIL